jgi:hypothetical protein
MSPNDDIKEIATNIFLRSKCSKNVERQERWNGQSGRGDGKRLMLYK